MASLFVEVVNGEALTGVDQQSAEEISLLDPSRRYRVTINETTRSLEQNRLYRKNMKEVADYYGDDAKHVARRYRQKFLVDIYRRDDTGYEAMCCAIESLLPAGLTREYDNATNGIVDITSTTQASVKQMREYIDLIHRDAISKGISITIPNDDRYF